MTTATAQNLRVALSAYVVYAALLSRTVHVTCPYRRLTGHRCPLCGTTTSVRFLTRGDWRRAVKSNPLGIAVVAAAAVLWTGASVAGNSPASRLGPDTSAGHDFQFD